jgi:hypothetical protein
VKLIDNKKKKFTTVFGDRFVNLINKPLFIANLTNLQVAFVSEYISTGMFIENNFYDNSYLITTFPLRKLMLLNALTENAIPHDFAKR